MLQAALSVQHPATLTIHVQPDRLDQAAQTIDIALTSLDAGHAALLNIAPRLTYSERTHLLVGAIDTGHAQHRAGRQVTTLTLDRTAGTAE